MTESVSAGRADSPRGAGLASKPLGAPGEGSPRAADDRLRRQRRLPSAVARVAAVLAALLSALCMGPVAAKPVIEGWRTANGVPVMFVAAPEVPMFKVRVVFAAGSVYDGDTPGIAEFTASLLGDGTGDLDTDAFLLAMEETGAEFGAGALRDFAWVSLKSLSDPRHADPALALAAAALASPRFDPEDVARTRQQILAGFEQEKSSPGALIEKAMHHAVYGEHPYAHPSRGTPASIAALDRAALAAFHRRHYVTANAQVVIVGALTRERAAEIAARLVGDLPAGEKAARVPAATPLEKGQAVHIAFPGQQSHLMLAQPGITRHDPDYFPLVVGNHVLGGNGPVSLLFTEIREKRGLSYSVSSHFEPMAAAGPFVISLQTEHRREAEARAVLRETLTRFIAEGPDEAALAAARDNLIGGFPLRIDSNSKLLEYLTLMAYYDLPADYLETYTRAVAKVTAADVREAFARRIRLDRMIELTVGPGAAE